VLSNISDRRMLHLAIKKQRDPEEIGRLAAAAASVGMVDIVNVRYQTALHLAVILDRSDVMLCLLSLGASLQRQEQLHGDTPLHLACRLQRGVCLDVIFAAWTDRTAQQPARQDVKAIVHSRNYEGARRIELITVLVYYCIVTASQEKKNFI